jgi:hypothetical protein
MTTENQTGTNLPTNLLEGPGDDTPSKLNKPKPRPYGVWVGYCETCGWQTMGKIRGEVPPECCEACGQKPEVMADSTSRFQTAYREDVAAVICTIVELRSERVRKHAEGHGFFVAKVSAKRWSCFRYDGVCSTFGLKDDSAGWAYRSLEVVLWNVDWRTLTDYIRKNTPEMPKYLVK